jgi:hypothetical protein
MVSARSQQPPCCHQCLVTPGMVMWQHCERDCFFQCCGEPCCGNGAKRERECACESEPERGGGVDSRWEGYWIACVSSCISKQHHA